MIKQSKKLDFRVLGCGAWGLNFRNIAQLNALLDHELVDDDGSKGPKPEIIPANERRRAPLSVRLAVEASWQATQASGISPAELSSVFVSGLGDTQLTDYMCKALSAENKALSPTKFHNSVHNAAAGYWTISTGCMRAANSIAGFQESSSLTLLEALLQADAEQVAILLTFYDAPVAPILQGMLENQNAFAYSVVMEPAKLNPASSATLFRAEVVEAQVDWPKLDGSEELVDCYRKNPAAKILAFAQLLHNAKTGGSELLPLSSQTALNITVN